MSSSSGGGSNKNSASKAPTLKASTSRRQGSDSDWSVYTAKRKSNKLQEDPVSPNLKQIIDSHPKLNLTTANSNNFLNDEPADSNSAIDDINMDINSTTTSNFNVSNVLLSNDTEISNNVQSTNESSFNKPKRNNVIQDGDTNLLYFSSTYTGPIYIIIDTIDKNLHFGKLHPMKVGKLLYNQVCGVVEIRPIGARVRVTFDTIANANICLSSSILPTSGLKATIPASLIYSYGVIRMDCSISETEFFEGLESNIPIESFRRIPTRQEDGSMTPSKLVELKFQSPKLPERIAIFKVLFMVRPSVRSPIQCLNCLRFGHTGKFCRSKLRCSHCGEATHNIADCPSVNSRDPVCLHCKGAHRSTDRSCPEWNKQRSIKKIMAMENVSYADAADILKNNFVSKANSFSQIASRLTTHVNSVIPPKSSFPSSSMKAQPYVDDSVFPPLQTPKHYKYNRNKYSKSTSPSRTPRIPISAASVPSPNGAFLAYMEASRNASDNNPTHFNSQAPLLSEVAAALSNQISIALSKSQGINPLPSLSNLIESLLSSMFSIPPVGSNNN